MDPDPAGSKNSGSGAPLHITVVTRDVKLRRVACFFGSGARFYLAGPRSRPLVSCTHILLSRFHPGRGGATVLKVGVFTRKSDPATFCIPGDMKHNIAQFSLL